MKKSKFKEIQIFQALKEFELGRDLNEIILELGIKKNTFLNWKKKYDGLALHQLEKMKNQDEKIHQLEHQLNEIKSDFTILKMIHDKSNLNAATKISIVNDLVRSNLTSIERACRLINISRDSYYYKGKRSLLWLSPNMTFK